MESFVSGLNVTQTREPRYINFLLFKKTFTAKFYDNNKYLLCCALEPQAFSHIIY